MSKRKSTKHCCFVLFCGAPRTLLSERCAAGGHHRPSGVHGRMHIPVVNAMMAKGIIPMDDKYSLWTIGIPQKDYVNQLFDRPDPYSVLFYLFFVVFIFNKYHFCHYSAINFPKSSPEHYTVTPSSSGRSGWSAGRSPFEASLSAESFSAASASFGPRWRAC